MNKLKKEITYTSNNKYKNLKNYFKIIEDKYNTEIPKLEEEIKQKDLELNKIYHSKTWKLFLFYKKTISLPKKIIKKTIPISIRKKIKSIIESKILRKDSNIKIPKEILQEWEKFEYDNNHIDLFNFSVIAWDFRYQRPQQLAKHVGQSGNRVFYIKNEFIPQTNNKKNKDYAPIRVEKKDKNVYEITLSATRNIFIYNDKPSNQDKDLILASFKTIINKAKIINPIAKIDHPFWQNIINEFKIPYIYDCMDNHHGFEDNSKDNILLEQQLFKKSNYTIVTSNYLNKVAKKYNSKNIEIIKNAGDFNHFNISQKKLLIPDDISNIKTKIIGYYGAIAEWFDTEILEQLAINHNDKTIVLIGNITNNKVGKLSKKYKNILLLGEKPYSILPNYLQKFDVCIIPFILNELIKATHPVKIFEYLAAGKPIVATKMPEILNLKEVVFFSKKEDFSKQVDQALKTNSRNLIKSRIDIAKKNTWNIRANDLINLCNKILFPKVSIVLLSYNSHQMLDEAISSILNRSFYPNFELIIVDNNSDQKTIETIKKYSSNKRVIPIFNKENYGFAKGNNIGTERTIGEYIILINNDVLVTPGWISRLIFHNNSQPNIGLVGPVTNSIGNEAKINIEYNPQNINDLENTVKDYTSKKWGETLSLEKIAAFCWIISRQNYKKIGKIDEIFGRGMFEDDDYCYRIKKENLEIICAEDVFIHHYGGVSFKKMQSAEYQKIFNENKEKFENKWGIKWKRHKFR